MDKYIIVSPAQQDLDSIFRIISTFPTEKVILLSNGKNKENTEKFEKELEKFKVPSHTVEIKNYSVEELLKTIKQISDSDKEIIINISSGNKITSALMLCSAYVHGIKAVGVINDEVVVLPVLKLSYYKALTEKKMNILKILYNNKNCCTYLENLRKKLEKSMPLLSYHLHGNKKMDGLEQMELVRIESKEKKKKIHLSKMGKLLMKGYVTN